MNDQNIKLLISPYLSFISTSHKFVNSTIFLIHHHIELRRSWCNRISDKLHMNGEMDLLKAPSLSCNITPCHVDERHSTHMTDLPISRQSEFYLHLNTFIISSLPFSSISPELDEDSEDSCTDLAHSNPRSESSLFRSLRWASSVFRDDIVTDKLGYWSAAPTFLR